jgi:hypothetical protein
LKLKPAIKIFLCPNPSWVLKTAKHCNGKDFSFNNSCFKILENLEKQSPAYSCQAENLNTLPGPAKRYLLFITCFNSSEIR